MSPNVLHHRRQNSAPDDQRVSKEEHLTTTDVWQHFRQRVVAGDARAAYVQHWKSILNLLELPLDQRHERLAKLIHNLSEVSYRQFYEMLQMMCVASSKKAGLQGISDQEEFARRYTEYLARRDAEAAQFAALADLQAKVRKDRTPPQQVPYRDDELRVANERAALWAREAKLVTEAEPGLVTDEHRLEALALLADYRRLLDATPPANRARRLVEDGLAMLLEQAARISVGVRYLTEAMQYLREAKDLFASLGDQAAAQRCREKLLVVQTSASGDLDAAAADTLQRLMQVDKSYTGEPGSSASTGPTPLDRAEMTVKLLEQSIAAGDKFEAQRLLLEGRRLLEHDAGFPPLGDGSVEPWLDHVPEMLQGTAFIGELARVLTLYASLDGASAMLDAELGAAPGQIITRQRDLMDLANKMSAEATQAESELEAAWILASGAPLTISVQLGQSLDDALRVAIQKQQLLMDLAARHMNLTAELQARMESGTPLAELLPVAQQLLTDGRGLNQPVYVALTHILMANLLLAMERYQDAAAAAAAGRTEWTVAFQQRSDSSAQERTMEAHLLVCLAKAQAPLGDLSALSDSCREAIALIEHDRYKINSPYQQAAFLQDRGLVYMLGIFAAYKLGDHEQMLERMELGKARWALRLHYLPDPPSVPTDTLEEEFRAANEQLKGEHSEEVEIVRRRIWDLLAIQRAHASGGLSGMPDFSLSNVQSALASDEVVLYYYFLNATTLLAVGIDSNHCAVERVLLTGDPLATIDYLRHQSGQFNENLDLLFGELGEVLLPQSLSDLMEGKRRLIVSPHHALHLVPFHALRRNRRLLIKDVAVSYVPNLGALLAPAARGDRGRMLIIGVSSFSKGADLAQLPAVERELEYVEQVNRQASVVTTVLQNSAATRATLQGLSDSGELAQYGTIHLATHGASVLDEKVSDAPMESFIDLADGRLDALALSRLRLNADLVVMTACYSGQRAIGGRGMPDLPGDDLFGLQAALNIAGARTVLGCLWPTFDFVVPDIVKRFYQELTGGATADVALQRAMLEHLERGKNTASYYWAPFFVSVMARGGESTPMN